MRPCVICLRFVAVIIALVVPPARGDEPPAQRLTLEQSVGEAFARSPSLQAKRSLVAQAEGRLVTAKTYPFNPEIVLEGARRTSSGASFFDRGVRLTQEIEIAGQQGQRRDEFSAELAAARAQVQREERLLSAGVRSAFVLALAARERLEIERANTDLARSLADVSRKRFESGAAPPMEVNLAVAQAGRAERDRRLAEGAYQQARVVLGETVGLDPLQPPEPSGELALPRVEQVPLADLVASALDRRADLQSFRNGVSAAQSRIERNRREAVPNLLVSAFYAQEAGTDRLVGGTVGIQIPLFNRRQGAIAEALASHQQVTAETAALELRIRQEIASARVRSQAATEAASTLARESLGSLRENLDLLQRSFEAGKTGWSEVLLFRREFVDAQRDYVVTIADAWLATIELDLASEATSTSFTSQESEQ